MENLEIEAKKYAIIQVQGSFSGDEEQLRAYCMEDFIAGAEWYKQQSKSTEMLKMLEYIVNNDHLPLNKDKIYQLIKEATEI